MQNYGYQGYGYQPYGVPSYQQRAYNYQPQQMAQPQMQSQQQPQMQYEIPIQDVRFVTSEEAKAYIVMPNSKALLIDKGGMAYLKTADNMGQSQTDYFRFERVNADGTPLKPQEPTPQVDFNEFVKIDEFKALQAKFDQLIKRLEVNKNVGQPKQANQ